MKKVCLSGFASFNNSVRIITLWSSLYFATSPTERVKKKHSHTLALHRLAMQILLHLLQPHFTGLPSSYFHCFH